MIKRISVAIAIICSLFCGAATTYAWGVWGHSKINRGAILALPLEVGLFFYNHADFITEESVAPDIRKYTMGDKTEFPRHYIDLENYNYTTPASMPKTLDAAKAKYGKDSVDKFGTLPWTIQEVMTKLTAAMKAKNKSEILFLSANLGHYIGDAHMPLHTTINHDGQLTGQKGIHALWESHLPELFGKNYSLYTADVHYIDNVEKATWDIIDSSHKLMIPLLYNDKKLRKDKPIEMLYKLGTNGQPEENKYGQKTHAYEYAHVYHELLGGMVENQMRAAISATASFWYTAWVNAGKPDLTDLDPKYITERNEKFYKEDVKYFKQGKVTGYKVTNEYQ
ncbi:S1/P1 Nuclease [Flavipsychrobacter stenotrophus]|uniref:S1/P1 Nuclease n=1 Tax=Flavipsychrobacter stenotrophus TaxID=2077091 RepID=A0A2S7SWN9_9BACT|nr:zinc dependent phospholipase C family protein [Flavipsychrobacter stenotrophus]PQJ11349.1 S1/P1 Nuclease [Flavipsychrobacter stenotrophus]